MSRNKNIAEEILGSKGRIRVLQVLTQSVELNISEISRRTGLNYTSVERHLTKLEKYGIVKEKRYGKIRIFQILFTNLNIRFEKGSDPILEIDNTSEFKK
ncbi:winged helix-turn-helix transcriptional regulator [Candidatus Bathyarchaeota archaeon]|nr:winged helix-turn-helix transcriptional regulator [Candidatus Bathyarchaeota archaeon]